MPRRERRSGLKTESSHGFIALLQFLTQNLDRLIAFCRVSEVGAGPALDFTDENPGVITDPVPVNYTGRRFFAVLQRRRALVGQQRRQYTYGRGSQGGKRRRRFGQVSSRKSPGIEENTVT